MNKIILFTDGSVNTQSGIGYGAYLMVTAPLSDGEQFDAEIKTKRFERTSSSRLELQTLLWALGDIPERVKNIVVYTDSQTIVGLYERRARFERNDYKSKKGVLLKNADLYMEFFKVTDKLNCEFIKVKGHSPGREKDKVDLLFAMVDRAARRGLREEKV